MAHSHCVNHPDRAATARCHTCHKPVCDTCTILAGKNTFCSDRCFDNYEKFGDKKLAENSWSFFSFLKGWVANLLFLAGLLALAVFAGAKLLNIEFCRELMKRVGL